MRRGRTSSRELGRTCRITAVRRCRERYNSASDIDGLRAPRPIRQIASIASDFAEQCISEPIDILAKILYNIDGNV